MGHPAQPTPGRMGDSAGFRKKQRSLVFRPVASRPIEKQSKAPRAFPEPKLVHDIRGAAIFVRRREQNGGPKRTGQLLRRASRAVTLFAQNRECTHPTHPRRQFVLASPPFKLAFVSYRYYFSGPPPSRSASRRAEACRRQPTRIGSARGDTRPSSVQAVGKPREALFPEKSVPKTGGTNRSPCPPRSTRSTGRRVAGG
jgi:hypothetical protein